MYPIRDYPNPTTRELIALANEYGHPLEFANEPRFRDDTRRVARFRFTNSAEMKALHRFLLDRGFQAALRVDEDDDNRRYAIVCPTAIDR
jgi:hypothetical protein